MSSRRGPLTSNPHAANSPLRAPSALLQNAKAKRSYANAQREEAYGQPPPIKKQVLEDGTGRAVRSPSKLPRSQQLPQRTAGQITGRPPIKERTTSRLPTVSKTVQDDEHKEVWKKHYRAKFPKMVFYFESIPDDVRAKLTKRVTYLGAVSLLPSSRYCSLTHQLLVPRAILLEHCDPRHHYATHPERAIRVPSSRRTRAGAGAGRAAADYQSVAARPKPGCSTQASLRVPQRPIKVSTDLGPNQAEPSSSQQ